MALHMVYSSLLSLNFMSNGHINSFKWSFLWRNLRNAIFKRSPIWILELSDAWAVILFKAYNLSAISLNLMEQLPLSWTILLGTNVKEFWIIVRCNGIFSWSSTKIFIINYLHLSLKARYFSADTLVCSKRYFVA